MTATANPEQASDGGPQQASTIHGSNGAQFRLERLLAETRDCTDGVPNEQRTVYICKQVKPVPRAGEDEFVVKIKHQSAVPADRSLDSEATTKELHALRTFKEKGLTWSPHLVDFFESRDGDSRTTYLLMTKRPGRTLLDLKYYSLGVQERLEIQQQFIQALQELWKAGIAPTDRGLRNVLWDSDSKRLSIIDFEIWEEPAAFAMDEDKQLQLWGLKHQPPPATWHEVWKMHH